jgi:hypothetical protein
MLFLWFRYEIKPAAFCSLQLRHSKEKLRYRENRERSQGSALQEKNNYNKFLEGGLQRPSNSPVIDKMAVRLVKFRHRRSSYKADCRFIAHKSVDPEGDKSKECRSPVVELRPVRPSSRSAAMWCTPKLLSIIFREPSASPPEHVTIWSGGAEV